MKTISDVMMNNLIFTVVIGVALWMLGYLLETKPPQYMKGLGYRTKRSKKNETLWNEANRTCSKVLKRDGMMLLVVGVVLSLFVESYAVMIAVAGIMLYLILMLFLRVEMTIKVMDDVMEKKK